MFQFKFVSSDACPPAQAPDPPKDQRDNDKLSLTDVKKPPFQLIKDVSQRLRDRRKVNLDYSTIDLTNTALSEAAVVAPLLQVRCNVGAESSSNEIVEVVDRKNTDILPGVYEGGLKVWECSLDLCRYLALHCDEILETGSKILELGCGHGLPACLLLREGLKRSKDVSVMFTDYNDFVLYGVSLSNIILNIQSLATNANDTDTVVDKHVVMGAGDWTDMSEQLSCGTLHKEYPSLPQNGRFDIILAAETTYTSKAAQDTANLMARHLAPESGVGLVACKRYYFGVGGGSDAFREAAASQRTTTAGEDFSCATVEYRLSVETLQVYDSGVGNIRELLQVRCIPFL